MTGNDGRVYQTIKIGNQWWMAENLRETRYRNGNEIPVVLNNTTWSGLSTGARCSHYNIESNADTYGYLYNWFAAVDARKIAPSGWRVPTDADYTTLENYLIANGYNWDGTTTGDKTGKTMASSGGGWTSSGTAGHVGNDPSSNNTSGFSALPAGWRYGYNGAFSGLGRSALFWSATEFGASRAWSRSLDYDYSDVTREYYDKEYGFSLRLIRE
jgi:uncharacterized protein (TIGR02145 family)